MLRVRFAPPLRAAVTGTAVSLGLFDGLEFIGEERVVARLKRAVGQDCSAERAARCRSSGLLSGVVMLLTPYGSSRPILASIVGRWYQAGQAHTAFRLGL